MPLVTIDEKGHQLNEQAATAFLALKKDAEAAGFVVAVSTAFRTHGEQKILYARYVGQMAAWQRAGADPKTKPTPVAVPGKSRHESGLAVDIKVASQPKLLEWLRLHAKDYGFFETVSREPWHWEYRPQQPDSSPSSR